MKTGLMVTAAVVFGLVLIAGLMAMGWYNTSVSLEASVKAQWQQNQNNYDKFWKTVKETAQVTDKYAKDFKEVFLGAVQGRYENGTGQVFAMIQEANPNLSPELYEKVQTVIEAGRTDFMRSQEDLLDKQRRYETHLNSASGALFGSFFSFPKEIMGDLRPPKDKDGDGLYTALDYPIVTSGKTKAAFETGEDEAVQVFGN